MGHIKRFCTSKVYAIEYEGEKQDEANVFTVMRSPHKSKTIAYIDKTPIPVFFLIGAQISIMSEKTAVENEFRIKKTDIVLRVANNEQVIPVGETEELEIQIANYHRRTC